MIMYSVALAAEEALQLGGMMDVIGPFCLHLLRMACCCQAVSAWQKRVQGLTPGQNPADSP